MNDDVRHCPLFPVFPCSNQILKVGSNYIPKMHEASDYPIGGSRHVHTP